MLDVFTALRTFGYPSCLAINVPNLYLYLEVAQRHTRSVVCQVSMGWMEKLLHSISISDTATRRYHCVHTIVFSMQSAISRASLSQHSDTSFNEAGSCDHVILFFSWSTLLTVLTKNNSDQNEASRVKKGLFNGILFLSITITFEKQKYDIVLNERFCFDKRAPSTFW